nr:reverse transcriptase domain-containing protein [Tanacetum cinerariifolium]
MATDENGDPPVPDLRTMEELCQPTLNGRGGPIAPIAIQATNFGLKNDMIQQVQNSFQFHGLPGDVLTSILTNSCMSPKVSKNSITTFEQMAKMFLGKYFPPSMVTKLKNEITNFRQHPDESLFEAYEHYKLSIDRCPNHNMLPVTQIDTFYNGLTLRHRDTINAALGGTFMKRRPEECYDLIENMIAHHNDWDTSIQRTTVGQTQNVYVAGAYIQGGASHSQNSPPAYQASGYQALVHQAPIPQPQVVTTTEFTNYMKANDAILKNMQTNMTSLTNSNLELKNMLGQFMKMDTASSLGSGTLPSNTIANPKEDLKGITTRSGNAYKGPTIHTTSSPPKVVERETEVTKDMVPPTNNGSTKDVQPPVVQIKTPMPNSEPVVASVVEPVEAPVSAPKPNQKPLIPYPSRLHDQKLRDKANDQKEKIFKIFQDLDFNISFADALILMPKFGLTIKSLLTNKEKLFELARTPLNEHCLTVLLKKLPEKMGDPGKFLIPCDFLGMDEFLALADLDASINLMPLSVWNKLFLPELSPMCMTLELVDRLISRPVGVAEDVFVKEEPCKECSQEVLGFFASGNPTPSTEPIVSNSSPTLTPFGDNDFLLEETDAFLAIDDVIKKEVLKLLDAELIYPISDSPWVSPVHCVPKKGSFTVVEDEENELIPTRLVTGWRVCIDYRKLNDATRKDHFPLPFMDQMLERLAGNEYYRFLDGFSGYFQIPIDPQDQEKTTFTFPYGTFATVLCLLGYAMHWACFKGEKSHFMVKEGIVLGHKISMNRIEVDKAKVDVIAKLPHPTTVKGIRSFLGHADFYRRFIQDFSKIARPMTRLLVKDTPFFFSKEYIEAFQILKKKLTEAPILVAPDWDLPFELMCDASDSSIARKPLIFSMLVTMDTPGDIMARTTPSKREKFHNVMKCLKIPFKFARISTFGASISWGRSRLYEGTSIYSWPSITCRSGLKRKRSPPTTPELFANS